MERGRGHVFGLLAAVAWSTAGLLQHGLTLDVQTVTAARAGCAAVALFAALVLTRRGRVIGAFAQLGRPGVAVAVCIALASSLFVVALHYTSVAHVLLLQAVSPLVAALLGRVVLGEPVHTRTWIAIALAVAGVAVMVSGPGGGRPVGDVLAAVSAASFAVSVIVMRKHQAVSMAPATVLAQVIVFAALAPFGHWGTVTPHDVPLIVAFGSIQMAGGVGLFTVAARLVPAAELAMLLMLEVVLGPLWVWIAFDNRPNTPTLIGGAVVLAAVAIQTRVRASPALSYDG